MLSFTGHCPEGVPEPTTPPAVEPTSAPEEHDHETTAVASCVPHGDHCQLRWTITTYEHRANLTFIGDCPEGVPEPTTLPALSVTSPAPSGTPTSEEHDHEATTLAPSATPTSEDHDHEATATTCEPHGDHCKNPTHRPSLPER